MKKSSNIFRIGLLGIIGAGILALYLMPSHLVKAREFTANTPAPAFTHNNKEAWINSPPLTLEQLRGQVVMLDFFQPREDQLPGRATWPHISINTLDKVDD